MSLPLWVHELAATFVVTLAGFIFRLGCRWIVEQVRCIIEEALMPLRSDFKKLEGRVQRLEHPAIQPAQLRR
ncbi:MAG TPA: hypothetical protein VMB05_18440 [Solirubrobacteraceae bacterium]|nr:hypothetical protein [Solirubrobacteraceae bacterium]